MRGVCSGHAGGAVQGRRVNTAGGCTKGSPLRWPWTRATGIPSYLALSVTVGPKWDMRRRSGGDTSSALNVSADWVAAERAWRRRVRTGAAVARRPEPRRSDAQAHTAPRTAPTVHRASDDRNGRANLELQRPPDRMRH
ncbi:unnamed protein product, partial [Iphiclides podalirius]